MTHSQIAIAIVINRNIEPEEIEMKNNLGSTRLLISAMLTFYFTAMPAFAVTNDSTLQVSQPATISVTPSCLSSTGDATECQATLNSLNPVAPLPSQSEGLRLVNGTQKALVASYTQYNTSMHDCRYIDNNGPNDYFVPQRSQVEYESFINSHPSDVLIENCVFPVQVPYTASASIPSSSYEIDGQNGSPIYLGSPIAQINGTFHVPQDQSIQPVGTALNPSISSLAVTTSGTTQEPINFLYTRNDCRTDAALQHVCNPQAFQILEQQAVSIPFSTSSAHPTPVSSPDGSWVQGAPTVTSQWSMYINGAWLPIAGPYDNYQSPPSQSCTVNGVTYQSGQSWGITTVSFQSPTSQECPDGAGTRVDDMSTTTSYSCNDGANAQSGVPITTETGFTGACAAPPVQGPDAVIIGASGFGACAISKGSLYCWGYNLAGNLGLGNLKNQASPKKVGALTSWTTLSSTNNVDTTCGIVGGALYCWGGNWDGQLGLGNTTNYSTPQRVGLGTNWSAVTAAGIAAACGIANGALYCWGSGVEIPLNTTGDVLSPQQVGIATNWTDISQAAPACGIAGGALYCWGTNYAGQLGNGTYDNNNHLTPQQVGSATNWTAIDTDEDTTCGIAGGKLYCWGVLSQGGSSTILSTYPQSYATTPQQIGAATNWTAISVRAYSVCGIAGGNLYCWGGTNSYGGFGLGFVSAAGPNTPQQVGVSNAWTAISFGGENACGINNGNVYCWGENQYGMLGINDKNFSNASGTIYSTPQAVTLP